MSNIFHLHAAIFYTAFRTLLAIFSALRLTWRGYTMQHLHRLKSRNGGNYLISYRNFRNYRISHVNGTSVNTPGIGYDTTTAWSQDKQKVRSTLTICLPLDKAAWTFCNRPSSSSNTSADQRPQFTCTHSSKPQQMRRPGPEGSASLVRPHRRQRLVSSWKLTTKLR